MSSHRFPPPASPDRVRRIPVALRSFGGLEAVMLPPYGYLEGFDCRLKELGENMDAVNGYRLSIALERHDNRGAVPLDLWAVVRDAEDYGGPDPLAEAPRPGEARIVCPACEASLVLDTAARTVRR